MMEKELQEISRRHLSGFKKVIIAESFINSNILTHLMRFFRQPRKQETKRPNSILGWHFAMETGLKRTPKRRLNGFKNVYYCKFIL
jgi:hypothetical protein